MKRTSIQFEKAHCAYTLIELAIVMAVLGAIAVAATTMLNGTNAVASMEVRQEAESLAYLFRMARSTAVERGSALVVAPTRTGQTLTGYQLLTTDGTSEILQPPHAIPSRVQMTWTEPLITFLPTGMSDRALDVAFGSLRLESTVSVLPAALQVRVAHRQR